MPFAIRSRPHPGGYTLRSSPSSVPMSSTPDSNSQWWYAVGMIAATFLGAVLKTFSDLVGRRDSREQKWREDLLTDVRELRAWNGRQQLELEDYHARVQTLEKSVKGEQELRHEIKNRLATEMLQHELSKQQLAASEEKRVELAAKLETQMQAAAKLEVQVHDLTKELASCAAKGKADSA